MAQATTRSGIFLGAMLLLAASCGSGTEDAGSTAEADASSSTTEDDATVTSNPSEPDDAAETASSAATTNPSDDAGDSSSDQSTPPPTTKPGANASTSPSTDGTPATGSGPIDAGLQPFIDNAVAQLSASHGFAPSEITVESARLVQWRDSSVGCPDPRMQYTQVLTDGSAIELVANGATYWFHSGGSSGPFPCTSPLREVAPQSGE